MTEILLYRHKYLISASILMFHLHRYIFMTGAYVLQFPFHEHLIYHSLFYHFLGTYAPDFTASVLSNSIRILKIDLHGPEAAQVSTYSIV